jgi:hypothetical protein
VSGVFIRLPPLGRRAALPRSLGARSLQAVSVLGLQPLGRLPHLRSEPAKPPLWYNRCVINIPFLPSTRSARSGTPLRSVRHPQSFGLFVFEKKYYKKNLFTLNFLSKTFRPAAVNVK